MSLAAHIRGESARLAALCTAFGECVRACPMTPYAAGVEAAFGVAIVPEPVFVGHGW